MKRLLCDLPARLITAAIVFLLLLSSGCSQWITDGDDVDQLVYGASFNMCIGYCTNRIIVEGTRVRLIESSRDPVKYPTKETVIAIPVSEAEHLLELAQRSVLKGVAGVHGCPDCADGGAEWIERAGDGETLRATFEYGDPPPQIADLQAALRSLRERLR
jgi:hypothetical protein